MAVDLIIRSEAVYDAATGTASPGHVAVAGDRILSAGRGPGDEHVGPRTRVVDAGDGLVVPGLHDNHTFVTALMLEHAGADVSGCTTASEVVDALRSAPEPPAGGVLLARDAVLGDAARAGLPDALDAAFPGSAAVVLGAGREWLVAGRAARAELGDGLDPGSNEALAPLYAALARDAGVVRRTYTDTARRMAAQGVVSVKEIAFDDYLGMLPVLDDLTRSGDVHLRISFASQPVQAPADLAFGDRARAAHASPRLRFHGFKLMTDGSFDEYTGDLAGPADEWTARQHPTVDYAALRREARRIVAAGHNLALNADGDGAVGRCLDVIEEMLLDGMALPDLLSLSDVSLITDEDARRAGALGVFCEVYTQLLLIEGYTPDLVRDILGPEREQRLGNHARLLSAGARLTSGTDLPLFFPSLGEAMLSAAERRFPGGGPAGGWHPERGLSRAQVVDSWTGTAAAAMGLDGWTGALRPGLRADVAVFDRDLLRVPADGLAGAAAVLTVAGGTVVHES
ncbi:amidohydrolase family protein [Cellulomonas sp. C5510]|uniref:amidohydrolase family protein n=1 Tax=Cellulomonas sp. C5510 TaxID=2871170 RepID=UPI001C95F31C|nr:amidohydrolase family protein [Cellulomonas sp. C5510]QZN85479.1 amidohydrolase family protein [Cellulomonas sp. C5510]